VLFSLAHVAFAALALVQQIDTTVPVQQGQRLVVDSHGGDIDVTTWSRNAVRVEAESGPRGGVQVVTAAGTVRVRTEGRRGPPPSVKLKRLPFRASSRVTGTTDSKSPLNVLTVKLALVCSVTATVTSPLWLESS
jgi:hypothetical protein